MSSDTKLAKDEVCESVDSTKYRGMIEDNQDRDLVLRRKKEKSLDYNNSFLGEHKCSSLSLDREERRDEKKRLDHLKQDQIMLVIKRFSKRKKVFRERKKTGKIRAKRDEMNLMFPHIEYLLTSTMASLSPHHP
nr:hypothetical protein [Tanacetum cinerariifolium]